MYSQIVPHQSSIAGFLGNNHKGTLTIVHPALPHIVCDLLSFTIPVRTATHTVRFAYHLFWVDPEHSFQIQLRLGSSGTYRFLECLRIIYIYLCLKGSGVSSLDPVHLCLVPKEGGYDCVEEHSSPEYKLVLGLELANIY